MTLCIGCGHKLTLALVVDASQNFCLTGLVCQLHLENSSVFPHGKSLALQSCKEW